MILKFSLKIYMSACKTLISIRESVFRSISLVFVSGNFQFKFIFTNLKEIHKDQAKMSAFLKFYNVYWCFLFVRWLFIF